jgi:type 1 glutamine amidotransferase
MIRRACLVLLFLSFLPLTAAAEPQPRTIVLIAGAPDADHPRGTHEYEMSVRLLAHCLQTSPDLPGVRVETVFGGWPRDEALLDRADTIVVIASGSDRREQDHPLLVGDRLQVLGRQMKRGCGLVLIHWCTFFPNAGSGEQALEWVGGHFDYQSGPQPRRWASDIQTLTTTLKPRSGHPVCRGVEAFEIRDELYYQLRFREKDPRFQAVLQADLPGVKETQTVAWTVQRTDGGRGFGFTGGHFFANWQNPAFRKLVLNAIVWTAHLEVPEKGVRSTPPVEGETLHYVEGRFGEALDARVSPALIDGKPEFRQPPLTVECWGRLKSKKGFNVLVASDPKPSPRHWELYTYAGSGALAAYLPGYTPNEIVSSVDVCDDRWHYLGLTVDGTSVKLYADGKLVKEQSVKARPGLSVNAKRDDGPLTIGMAQDGTGRVGCDGLIDDVRLSRGVRALDRVPTAELPLDLQTLALFHFDRGEAFRADPAWTPRAAVGNAASWEKETDADWIDGRFRQMDTGPFLGATIDHPGWQGKVRVYKALAVKVGDKDEAAVVFDRGQLRMSAGWTGWLEHTDKRFGLLNTPTPTGPLAFAASSGPGWASPDGKWDGAPRATAPLPHEWAHYRGLYQHGRHTVLSYTVGDVAVLESPWAETSDGMTVLTRTLEIAPSSRELRLLACELPGIVRVSAHDGFDLAIGQRDDVLAAVALVGAKDARLVAPNGRAQVVLPPSNQTRRVKLLLWQGVSKTPEVFLGHVRNSPPAQDLSAWTKAGPTLWGSPLVTRGELAADNAPLVVDTLTVPYDNPFHALFFITGVDFLPSGEIAICTAHGDVWLVKGAGKSLERLEWKRFATGLYQPLGLKVVDGKVVVLERGQLTRLHDRAGRGEADFYENVGNDWHTGDGQHSFDTCLEVDPEGNFYFFKTGDPETPTGGCLLRMTKDGSKTEIFATGFRHPIGLGMSPTGIVSGADQEGNWMPMTRIDFYHKGGFYGDMRTHHRETPPTIYDGPLLWLPREMDNSAGGQVWVPGGQWGPLGGQMLHLSYGRCKMHLILPQTVDGVEQAGAVDLGLFFLSGSARARFGPDQNLYVVGLKGWQTAARRDGCLQRVRYTDKPFHVPVALAVEEQGIRLTFAEKLDPKTAADLGRYRIEQWGYRWLADYGSKHWKVSDPRKEGHDAVPIESATLLPDGKTVVLRLKEVRPVMQMQIAYNLMEASGEPVIGSVYNTIHKAAQGR